MEFDMIYLGANYYPEDWDESEIDSDIEKMLECGFNVVRIAEFAWHKSDPREGEISFTWLHKVIGGRHRRHIGILAV